MDFSVRSERYELLDEPDIPPKDIQQNMHELAIINHRLGGHLINWLGFRRLFNKNSRVHICEIGCGGGDNLKNLETRASSENIRLSVTGIDINKDCIQVAGKIKWEKETGVELLVSDYKDVQFEKKPDIIFCSLFCHHFKEKELIELIRWMQANSRSGFFINDLHRHPLAYYSIRSLTSLFSHSYLVKNDAPLSVLRGFKRRELKDLLEKAAIKKYSIQWKWAFRWLVIVHA